MSARVSHMHQNWPLFVASEKKKRNFILNSKENGNGKEKSHESEIDGIKKKVIRACYDMGEDKAYG